MPNQKYKIDAFFAGVGGIEMGFENTNKFKTQYANEFEPHARTTYKLNHPNTKLVGDDIHDVDPNSIPNCDVIMGGFPCQAFSIAGYRKGFQDKRGDLFFEMLKMIKAKQPRIVFIENVKNLVNHDHDNTFKVIQEALISNGYGVQWKVLNTKDYGNLPQNRERTYIVGFKNQTSFKQFEFPKAIPLIKKLKDVIDFNQVLPEIYYYRQGKQKYYPTLKQGIKDQRHVYQWRRQYVRENKSGVIPTLTANMGTGGSNVPLILTNQNTIRKLTPKETFLAQGYPKSFKLPNNLSNSQLYKQAGNSVSVPVIQRIAEQILKVGFNKPNTTNFKIPKNAYLIIHTKLENKYWGESELLKSFATKQDAKKYAKTNQIQLDDTDGYFKAIHKNRPTELYRITKI